MATAKLKIIPRGLWYVFTTLADAQAKSSAVDATQVFPLPGVETGGGVHVPDPNTGGPFACTHYADIIAKPDGTAWALPSDPVIDAVLSGIVGAPQAVALDVTWADSATVPFVKAVQALTRRSALRAMAGVALATAGVVAAAVLAPAPSPTVATPDADIVDAGDAG